MAFLKVDDKKKTIIIDKKEVPTEADKFVFEGLIKAGYTFRYKSEKRAEVAKKRFKKKKDEAKNTEETK